MSKKPATSQKSNVLTIGRLAKAASVGVETIRYYERRELLPKPDATQGAFRQYPLDTVARIRFIKRSQELGFTLDEISGLLQLADGTNRRAIRNIATQRLDSIREKLSDLQRMESALAHLLHACEADTSLHCPIIDALSGTVLETSRPRQ